MTVSNQNQKSTGTGNGSSHQFNFNFKIAQASDLVVIVRTDATGAVATKTLDTDYIIPTSSVGADAGGNILFKFDTGTSSDAHHDSTDRRPPANTTVVMKREVQLTQGVDLLAASSLPSETLENAYDKLTFGLQQVQEQLSRALLRPATDTTSAALPDNIDIKGKFLKFNTSSGVAEGGEVKGFTGGSYASSTGIITFTSDDGLGFATSDLRGASTTATSSANGLMSASDKSKLDAVEASATADQTAAEIRTLVESASDSNVFTDADHSKLNAIEASATADQDASDIRALGFFDTSNDGASSGLDADKLDGQEGSHYLDAGNLTGTVANARLDAQLQDVAGLAVTDSGFIVGDGSNFVLETGATVRTSLGLGTSATLDTGISNTNVPKFTSGVVDDDFLRVNGTAIEGRSAAEVLSDIGGITASSTDTLTNKTIDASQLSGTVADARLPATISSDITGNAATATLASTTTVSDSTANTNFPVVFHDESNALLDDTGALRYNPSTGELLVPKLTVAGTTTTVDTVTMNAANAIVFEGATADAFETTLTIQDPTGSDKTITLPNATGTVLLADGDGSSLTSVNATTLDSVDSTSFLRSDAADTKSSGNLNFSDNVQAKFGDGGDLSIFHDGTNSRIYGTTGDTNIGQNAFGAVKLTGDNDQENMLVATVNGSVDLYHDNNKKLETTSTGATVTGSLATTSGVAINNASGYGNIEIGGTSGAFIDLKKPNSDDFDLRLITTGTGGEVVSTNTLLIRPSVGAVELYHDNSKKLETTSSGATVTGTLVADGLTMGDSESITLGDGSDFNILHSGNASIIRETGAAELFLQDNQSIKITKVNATETMAVFVPDGAVELYHDNSKKLETTSSGATVTGVLTADGLDLGDSEPIRLGASQDLQISHNGTNSFVGDDGGGSTLVIHAGTILLERENRAEKFLEATVNSSVDLYFDGTKRFETTSTGASITGDLTLTSTDDGDTAQPTLSLYRNSASPAFVDNLGQIQFFGENNADEKVEYARIDAVVITVTDGSEAGQLDFAVAESGSNPTYLRMVAGKNQFFKSIYLGATYNLVFEGSAYNDHETTLTVIDPTSDNSIQLPDASGQVVLSSGAIDTDASAEIGRAHVGFIGWSDMAGFSHVDRNSQTEYSLLQNANGTTYLNAASGQTVSHRINNSPIMVMSSSGLGITGDLTLTSSDAGSTENPTLDLYRNSSSPADNDILGHIHFSGENDNDEKIVYAEIETRLLDASDGTEDGRLVINSMTGGSVVTHYSTGFGFNQFHREVLLASGINLQFEGATNDGVRTRLTVADPTATRTITLPDSSGTVQLTSSSDRRLKKNIEPAQSASQKIDDINVYQFDWIEDGKHEDFGVVAQEMQEVFPDCVAVQDPDTGYLGIDYSKLVPVLLQELKDLRARVASLESK